MCAQLTQLPSTSAGMYRSVQHSFRLHQMDFEYPSRALTPMTPNVVVTGSKATTVLGRSEETRSNRRSSSAAVVVAPFLSVVIVAMASQLQLDERVYYLFTLCFACCLLHAHARLDDSRLERFTINNNVNRLSSGFSDEKLLWKSAMENVLLVLVLSILPKCNCVQNARAEVRKCLGPLKSIN